MPASERSDPSLTEEGATTVAYLKTTYTSPNATQTFTLPVTISSTSTFTATTSFDPSSTAQKTAYLSSLRQQAVALQADINTFLTQKMEEDKAVANSAQGADEQGQEKGKGKKVKIRAEAEEQFEEEHYGEEEVEEED